MTRLLLVLLALVALLASPLEAGAGSCCGQSGACCPVAGTACGTTRCSVPSARCAAPARSSAVVSPTSPRPAADRLRQPSAALAPPGPAAPARIHLLPRARPPRLLGGTSRFGTLLPPPPQPGG